MRCFVHSDREAVAVCAHCGKGACAECAGKSRSGRIVCSPACAASPAGRSYAIKGYLFHILGAILLVAGLYFVVRGPGTLLVFLAFAGIICFYKGIRPGGAGVGLESLYYRTGDAMEKVHQYRHDLGELLAVHARTSKEPVTLQRLDAADDTGRTELLQRVLEEIQGRIGKTHFEAGVRALAEGHVRELKFCQSLAEDYFEQNADALKTVSGRGRLERDIFGRHLNLRESIRWLATIKKELARET